MTSFTMAALPSHLVVSPLLWAHDIKAALPWHACLHRGVFHVSDALHNGYPPMALHYIMAILLWHNGYPPMA